MPRKEVTTKMALTPKGFVHNKDPVFGPGVMNSRPSAGYAINTPTKPWTGKQREDTIMRRPTITIAPQPRYRRVSTARPVIGPLGLKPRVIVP
jgi:hypothetical protein